MLEKINNIIATDKYVKELYNGDSSFKNSIDTLIKSNEGKSDDEILYSLISLLAVQCDFSCTILKLVAMYSNDTTLLAKIRDTLTEVIEK